MSIEGQGHFFTIYFPGLYVLCFTNVKISGERLQDQWSSGFFNQFSKLDGVRRVGFSSLRETSKL